MSEWIPTSERNPSEYGNYLITKTDGDVDIGTYNPNYAPNLHERRGWSSCDAGGFYWIGDGVVAWMELPKAYGKDGESDGRTD